MFLMDQEIFSHFTKRIQKEKFLKYSYEKNMKRRQDFHIFKIRKRSKNKHEFRKKAILTIFVDMSESNHKKNQCKPDHKPL